MTEEREMLDRMATLEQERNEARYRLDEARYSIALARQEEERLHALTVGLTRERDAARAVASHCVATLESEGYNVSAVALNYPWLKKEEIPP